MLKRRSLRILLAVAAFALLLAPAGAILADAPPPGNGWPACVRVTITASGDQVTVWDYANADDMYGTPTSISTTPGQVVTITRYLPLGGAVDLDDYYDYFGNYASADPLYGNDSNGTGVVEFFSGDDANRICFGGIVDGRLNMFDSATLAIIYPDGTGYAIWSVDPSTSEGTFDYGVTRDQVNAGLTAARSSGQNQEIAHGHSGGFYTLPDGTCIMTGTYPDGKTNQFQFNCGS